MALNAWSASAALINGDRVATEGGGASNAGLVCGGHPTNTGSAMDSTEEWDGTAYSSGGILPAGVYYHAVFGTLTAAVSASGLNDSTASNEYNGTSWSAGGTLGTGRERVGGWGTQTDGMIVCGDAGGNVNNVDLYNGTSWSSGTVFPTTMYDVTGVGSTTAGLAFTGVVGASSRQSTSREFNGTTWTSGNAYVAALFNVRSTGTQADAFGVGGANATVGVTTTAKYNGTTWTASEGLSIAQYGGALMGTTTSAQYSAGKAYNPILDKATTQTYGNYNTGSYGVSSTWSLTPATETSVTIRVAHLEDGDVGLLFITKDDDVAPDAITGWTSIGGWESTNAIWTEIYKRDCDGTETTITITGDNEEWAAICVGIAGADYSTVGIGTQGAGVSTSPLSPAVTPPAGSLVIAGFGVDGDSTPFTPDTDLTNIGLLQTSSGAGSAGMYLGLTNASLGSFTHTLDSSDEWTAFTVYVEAAAPTFVISWAGNGNHLL
jgi:hypothetical protein